MFISFFKTPIFLLLFLFQSLHNFAQTTFQAVPESPEVTVGAPFEVIFELKNGDGERFQGPNFSGFKKLSGPSTQTSVTIINGKYSKSMGWTFILQVNQAGTLTIPSASVLVNGKTLQSAPVTLQVTASKRNTNAANQRLNTVPNSANSDDLFVAFELDKQSAWMGEQVIGNYVLYTRVGVESFDMLSEADYTGFFAKNLEGFKKNTEEHTIKGKKYVSRILKSMALFPQKEGDLEIVPSQFRFGVVTNDSKRDPFNAFFGRGIQPLVVANEAKTLKVKALPMPIPENFSGGVGQYNWKVEADKKQLSTDDAINLMVSVQGNGDEKRFLMQKLNLPDEFEVYEPKITEQETYENGGEIRHAMALTYAVLPKKAGEFNLRPSLIYFNTDSGRYITLLAPQALQVNISQGKNAIVNTNIAPNKTLFIANTSANFEEKGSFWFYSPIYWALLLLPFLGLGGYYFTYKFKQKNAVANASNLEAKQSYDIATMRLSKAKTNLNTGNYRDFYDELSKAMQGYLTVKMNLVKSDFSSNILIQKLQEKSVTPHLMDDILALMSQSELALFAGQSNPESAHEAYKMAEIIIRTLELENPKK
jgi:BatD DUF11 like domain